VVGSQGLEVSIGFGLMPMQIGRFEAENWDPRRKKRLFLCEDGDVAEGGASKVEQTVA
jgi:hypothetical protein